MGSDDHTPGHEAGFFDTFDSIADVVRRPPAGDGRRLPGPPIVPGRDAEPDAHPPAAGHIFHPTIRRPMALLHVVDDGRDDGEIVRLRGDVTVVGRAEGDVVIPHDLLMSPRHARLERLPEGGWRLSDLGSATGTFVRVDRAKLRHDRVIQVGGTRLRFQEVDITEAWLLEESPTGVGRRHECHAPVTTIGRGGCTIALDDPFVSEIHAEVRRSHNSWRIRNAGANGLWVRIDEPVELRAPAQFLCGEQRFVFEPLG